MKIELSKAFLAVGLPCLFLLSQINDVHGVQDTSFSSPTSSRRDRKLQFTEAPEDIPTKEPKATKAPKQPKGITTKAPKQPKDKQFHGK